MRTRTCPQCKEPGARPAGPDRLHCERCNHSFPAPASPGRRRRKDPDRPGFFQDWRVYAVAGYVFVMVAVPVLLLGALGVIDLSFGSSVTLENYEELKLGMSEQRVRSLLGPHTGADYRRIPAFRGKLDRERGNLKIFPVRFLWENGEDVIWVDIRMDKIVRFGATLDGERYGADPDPKHLGQADPNQMK
jgi:hypothetical protein